MPPSAVPARWLTILAVALPILLPVALWYAHRARQESALMPDSQWRPRLVDRPILFHLAAWAVTAVVIVGGYWLLGSLGVSPV
jgi:hypothetical protein